MKHVTILALEGTSATTLTGPMDVFSMAGVLWNKIHGLDIAKCFEVETVTPDGAPISCNNGFAIHPHRAMTDIEKTDLIIVGAIFNIETTLAGIGGSVAPWLRKHYRQGTHLASICTGSFILAHAGLLNGKKATTHWAVVDEFRQLYPEVELKPERLITDGGDIFCSGAMSSCIDMAIFLVEKYYGHRLAVECAKSLAHDIGRDTQQPYTPFRFQRNHSDDAVLQCQHFFENSFQEDIDLDKLARQSGMGRRTLERRFKAATGDSPLTYLQRVRVEKAKSILESELKNFDEISYEVGYEDSSFFRKVFIKHTGLRPREYRSKFQRGVAMID